MGWWPTQTSTNRWSAQRPCADVPGSTAGCGTACQREPCIALAWSLRCQPKGRLRRVTTLPQAVRVPRQNDVEPISDCRRAKAGNRWLRLSSPGRLDLKAVARKVNVHRPGPRIVAFEHHFGR